MSENQEPRYVTATLPLGQRPVFEFYDEQSDAESDAETLSMDDQPVAVWEFTGEEDDFDGFADQPYVIYYGGAEFHP